jgi:hypothetical protein
VFSTGDIIDYPGNSGGPLCVQYTNGVYYPAGVYIGGTANTIVRAIDSSVADLINRANVTANTGAIHSGGGVINLVAGAGGIGNPGFLEVTIAPPAAFQAGGAWKLSTLPDADYSTENPSSLEVTTTNQVQLQFKQIPGWNIPTNQFVSVGTGTILPLAAYYTAASNQLSIVVGKRSGNAFTFTFSAAANQTYEIQTATNLSQSVWTTLTNSAPETNSSVTITEPISADSQQFYRVAILP